MGVEIKINGATVIQDSTIENTDLDDARLGLEIRAWFVRIVAANPNVTSIYCEKT